MRNLTFEVKAVKIEMEKFPSWFFCVFKLYLYFF